MAVAKFEKPSNAIGEMAYCMLIQEFGRPGTRRIDAEDSGAPHGRGMMGSLSLG
jgi:hypothetical protein